MDGIMPMLPQYILYVKPVYQTEDLPYIINDTINFSAR